MAATSTPRKHLPSVYITIYKMDVNKYWRTAEIDNNNYWATKNGPTCLTVTSARRRGGKNASNESLKNVE